MTHSDLLKKLQENPFLLAPMAGITDRPFRSFMREQGCGIVISELVSATGLKFSSQKTRKLMEFDSAQHPVGIQLFGENLEHLAEAAKAVEDMGADFVDLNFGCPVPKVVNKGAGSACLKDLLRLRDVIRATKSGVSIPVTIKIRTGWDQATRNSHDVVRVAHDEGVTWVAIHGRTRAAQYTGAADWDYIREVKARSPVPIVGNGDITDPGLAVRRLCESGCDAVMIGRGCLKNPHIFAQALRLHGAGGGEAVVEGALDRVLMRLLGHLEGFYDERLTLLQMRKFASWYSAGFPAAAAFRKELFQLHEKAAVLARIGEFFGALPLTAQTDTSHEPFLMGGHG
ncbi:MAG: tRNA dihydrouridine synthase DusB [Calothrix sp. SM1_5_4]|nr:tRNA dihydrouridine synthase DusB [Calothrix sp. SM1_5_4]